MRARWLIGLVLLASVSGAIATPSEPKPETVDIKSVKDKMMVFQDAKGGTYVVLREKEDKRVYYGTGKTLYAQRIHGGSTNGDAWTLSSWAPRIPEMRPADLGRLKDGTYRRFCTSNDILALTQLTGDKAKKVLDTYTFMSPALVRLPFLLARDDSGVYYYVDAIRDQVPDSLIVKYRAHRVFVGKKGAMKQVTLTDVASDSAGTVLSSKTGDLRLVKTERSQESVSWHKGGKKHELILLDLDVNSPLIFSDLGVYTFIGTLCDNV